MPVTQSTLAARKRGKCRGCGQYYEARETIVVLRLKKAYRAPCSVCGHKLTGSKRFHPNCVPSDINAAMGYDASKHVHNAPSSHTATVAPPPKPPSPRDAALSALVSLENALILKLRNTPNAWHVVNGKRVLTPEWEKQFTTFQGIKARAVRPGTDAEGDTAVSLALQRLVKMVFNQ